MSLSEINELDAGAWFGPEFAGTPVPSLGEVLESLWEEELQLVVELKAEARCDTTDEGASSEEYWDGGASSKAINKAPSTSRCSSQQFEKRFVQSIMELLDSLETPAQSGHGRTQGCLRVLFASFNHRLIDQLTMELGRRQGGSAPSLVQGTAYILHPKEAYDGQNFLGDVKWLAPHWSKTKSVIDTKGMYTGRQVVAWVADDLLELRHQVDLGVSGVITNNPSLCRQLCS